MRYLRFRFPFLSAEERNPPMTKRDNMNTYSSIRIGAAILAATPLASQAQSAFPGFVNHGLVAVGTLSGDTFDAAGQDTLGGIGSGMFPELSSWTSSGSAEQGMTYSGELWAVSDRGSGSSGFDYHPRVHAMRLVITPYYGAEPVGQTQITLTNSATTPFTYAGHYFSGIDAADASGTAEPRTLVSSAGQGRASLDPEGLVRLPNGDFVVCDEYGPFLYRFNAAGELQSTLQPPAAFIPKRGSHPNLTNFFTGASNPTTGRVRNRGFEGLALSPDGKRLYSILQDPIVQDGGLSKASQNNRILVWDVEPGSALENRPVAEYVYRMTLSGSATANNIQTGASELCALNREELLVIERDGNGFGAAPPTPFSYKRVVLVSLRGATNLINSGYDLDLGAPGALGLPANAVPANIAPVSREDFVDLLDPAQLGRFGLNLSTNWDNNTLSEKWESLALIPLNEPASPHDFLLLTCNDNDFLAHVLYVNGQPVMTNSLYSDTRMLAFRVTLPTYGAPPPANLPPGGFLLSSSGEGSPLAPAAFTLSATAYDQDGCVTNVLFYEGTTLLGRASAFPFSLSLTDVPAGRHDYTVVVQDNEGAATTSAVLTVTVAANQIAIERTGPDGAVTLRWPEGAVLQSASQVEGTYLDVPDATSPWVVPTGEAMRYFRLRSRN